MLTTEQDATDAPVRSGLAKLAYKSARGGSSLVRLEQRPPLRVLFPRPVDGGPPQAVLLNTGGGLVGGDRLTIEVEAGSGSHVVASTAAAEKVYRSIGPTVDFDTRLVAGAGAALEWLPQETILFDRARFRRRTRIERAECARVTFLEMTVFGRHASGERFLEGRLTERLEVRSAGRLQFLDVTRLDGDVGEGLRHRFGYDGACAAALLVHAADDAERHLEAVREALTPASGACGATIVQGVLVVRWLTTRPAALRASIAAVAGLLRRHAMGLPEGMPQVWWT